MTSALIDKIRTKEDKDIVRNEISILQTSLYDGKWDVVLGSKIRSWVSDIIKAEAGSEVESRNSYLKSLDKELEDLQTLKLTIAFEPSSSLIDKIADFVKKNMGNGIIIEITPDPNIIAGAIVSYKGKLRDYSAKNKIWKIFNST